MAKAPTKQQRMKWDMLAQLGCAVSGAFHAGRITIHHCFTGGGGRKNHDKIIPLCWEHHLGANGIDGKRISKREWQAIFGSEQELLERMEARLYAAN